MRPKETTREASRSEERAKGEGETNCPDAFLRSYVKYRAPLSGDHANRHRVCHRQRVGELLACTSDIQKSGTPGYPVR